MAGYWAVWGGEWIPGDFTIGSPTGSADVPTVNILGQISLCGLADQTDPMTADVQFTRVHYVDDDGNATQREINGPVFQQNRVTTVEWKADASNGGINWSVLLLEADS